MKIAIIEPYYGGSHKAFWDGLAAVSPYQFQFYTLPAHKWKWRMRLAAPIFARNFSEHPDALEGVSLILCSPYLDVAAFKGLLPANLQAIPVFAYFHENQFDYPVQLSKERDVHFALTNLTTALAADRIAFNSRYNLQSFIDGARKLLRMIPDMKLAGWTQKVRAKATILHPAIDFTEIDRMKRCKINRMPVIVWNHRWEHDKNPQLFFQMLSELKANGHEFKIIILGESFRQVPDIFVSAKERFKENTIHFGYVRSRRQYLSYLKQGDIIVSTARHEFYGISVIEAVRAGCMPLLPDGLSYPELFPRKYLYKEGELTKKMLDFLPEARFSAETARKLTEQFSWPSLLPHYKKWLNNDSL